MELAQSIQQVNAELLQRLIRHGPEAQSDIQVHEEDPKRARVAGQTDSEASIATPTATTATATATAEAPLKPGFEPRRRFMVEGRIIHKRKLSRKLFFLDLSLSQRKQQAPQLLKVKGMVADLSETGAGAGAGSERDIQGQEISAPNESEWEDVLPKQQQQQQQGDELDPSIGRSKGLQRIEVIGRYPTHSLKDLDDLWHRVQLGAVVRVFGDIELSERRSSSSQSSTIEGQDQPTATGHRWSVLLHVLDFEVLETWQGKENFEPNPGAAEMGSSKKSAKKQQQQQQQQQQPGEKKESKKRKSGDLGEQTPSKVPLDRGDASQPHCKFWLNSGKCNKQKCDFWHETDQAKLKIERRRWVEERIQAKRQLSHHSCDPHQSTTKNQHRERSLYFAQWLIQTFTREFLESGSGVLDIAGGRGDLSWELQTRQGVRSTIIEPRPGKGMRKWQRKWLEKFVAENRAKRDTNTDIDIMDNMDRDGCMPQEKKEEEDKTCEGNVAKKQKTEVATEDKDDDGDDDDKEPEAGGDKDLALSSFIPTVKTYPLQTTEPARIQALMDDAFLTTHRELVASASVLIGLHPDQATEPIVRAALKAGKPFAVIPCCVFGRDNPHRRLPVATELSGGSEKIGGGEVDGAKEKDAVDMDVDKETGTRAVTSYEDFVTWLTTLHPGIETTWLNFEGMNRVLFWRGCSSSSSK